jgi:hypothetical protein
LHREGRQGLAACHSIDGKIDDGSICRIGLSEQPRDLFALRAVFGRHGGEGRATRIVFRQDEGQRDLS